MSYFISNYCKSFTKITCSCCFYCCIKSEKICLVSYVINIGYSRAWKKWPAIVSACALLLVAAYGYFTAGMAETQLLAQVLWAWEFYVFAHLGSAFIVAALIGTPGCEMRAFHDLYSRITGNPTKEHYCPIGPLHPVDQWEARGR